MQAGYGEYDTTGQSGYGGFGAYGFGDATSDAQSLYSQLVSGDIQGAAAALQNLASQQGVGYAQSVCQAMGELATTADAAAAAQSGQVTSQSQDAVIGVCTAAGVSTGASTTAQIATIFQQIQSGQAGAAIQALLAMDAPTRSYTCQKMGELAYAADVAAAGQTSVAAYTNQNAVISACTAAGVTMPPAGATPSAPAAQATTASVSGASVLLLGAVGVAILYFVFR